MKMEVITIKNKTLQEWLPIKEIDKKGVVKLKKNDIIAIQGYLSNDMEIVIEEFII